MRRFILFFLLLSSTNSFLLFSMNGLDDDHLAGKCTICWENLSHETTQTSRCAHRFHAKCVQQWLELRQVCPFCSEALTRFQLTMVLVQKAELVMKKEEQEDDRRYSSSDGSEQELLEGQRSGRARGLLACFGGR